MRNKFF